MNANTQLTLNFPVKQSKRKKIILMIISSWNTLNDPPLLLLNVKKSVTVRDPQKVHAFLLSWE